MLLPDLSNQKNTPIIEIIAALAVSVISGLVASTGDYIYVLGLIGAVLAVFIAFSPVALLFSMILIGLVFAGFFRTYYPQLEYVRWLVLPGSIILFMHAMVARLNPSKEDKTYSVPTTLWWVIALLLITISSGVINNVGPSVYIASYKGYFQVWGILFALAFIEYDKKVVEQLPKLFLIIAFIQLPLVLQQYFILAPGRMGLKGIVPIDVVSGTFGISPMGGNNALLSAYLFICIAGCIALWQEKIWSTKMTIFVCALLFFPTLMNEAKIGLLFLIAIFLILFSRYIFFSFSRFIYSVLGLIISVSILLWAFTVNVHENATVRNPVELLQYTYETNVEKDETWSGSLSRFGTYKYWFEQHGVENIRETLIGHGVGASRQRQEQKNTFEIASGADASLGIGSTAFSAILWESGVLGLICVIGLFVSGFLCAIKLSKVYSDDKYQRAMFRAISAAIVILFIDFMSKSYFVFQVGYQTILFTLLGYLLYWNRVSAGKTEIISGEYVGMKGHT